MRDFNDLIGKPFDPEGYGPDGYSCYGLAVEVFARFGIQIPRTNISVCACKEASQQEIQNHIALHWEPIEKPVSPCGIVIRSTNPDYANHIGVYIGNGRMIHATMGRAVAIDRVADWKHKIIGFYAYVGNRR